MNLPRFFCPGPLSLGATVTLPENAARHAVRVLRLGEGATLTLFNGEGGQCEARIVAVKKEAVRAEVLGMRAVERESPLRITLAQALQAGDKMDLTVQKAVELGVVAVQPLASRRSVIRLDAERAARRVEHWRGIAASACEQCGRNRVPAVGAIASLEAWLSALPAAAGAASARLMLLPDAADAIGALPAAENVILLVGPEGGFDREEAAAAQRAGFLPVRMGPRVLRTETAGLAALAALQALWGDFRGDSHV